MSHCMSLGGLIGLRLLQHCRQLLCDIAEKAFNDFKKPDEGSIVYY